jgi:NitT/TauT family transport system permease protein
MFFNFYHSKNKQGTKAARVQRPPLPSAPMASRKEGGLFHLVLPFIVVLCMLLVWHMVCYFQLFPAYALPSPGDSLKSFQEEIDSGRLSNNIIASLWRVALGFVMSTGLGIPIGLFIGQYASAKHAFLPVPNFFRFLSPLAWIPFAILWFHIGDLPAIFLIFMATFFPLVLTTISAVANIPGIYFCVAKDYHYKGFERITKVTLPAVLPQLITGLRICYGIAWVVIVAAEMVGCQDGLGYGIWDARNGLRLDIAVSYMLVIGVLGMVIDRLLTQLIKLPNVRWYYER